MQKSGFCEIFVLKNDNILSLVDRLTFVPCSYFDIMEKSAIFTKYYCPLPLSIKNSAIEFYNKIHLGISECKLIEQFHTSRLLYNYDQFVF